MRMKHRHGIEKGETFRKSVCRVLCSDSGDSDGVDSETDTPKKARKAEKREEKNNKEVEKGRWKKESREKMTSAHHNKKHSSRGSPSSSERKHSRSKHACNSKTEVSTITQPATHLLDVYDILWTIFLQLVLCIL